MAKDGLFVGTAFTLSAASLRGVSWACQSLMSRMSTSFSLFVSLAICVRIEPRAFCGPGMRIRNAIVGATSIMRTFRTLSSSLRTPGPLATKTLCMLML